jgi:hypothetical protein
MDVKQLYGIGEDLFKKRQGLTSFWQEISDNFYPERAIFTVSKNQGELFASNLMTSYPILVRRELGNQFSSILRPTAKPWFHPGVKHLDKPDNDTKSFLEYAERTQRRAMYDRRAQFTRATKEADHDYAAFGQAVISHELNKNADGILYRCWHLKDVAWQEDESGETSGVFRRWKPTVQQLSRTFPGRVHNKVNDALSKDPFKEVGVMHIVVDDEMYDDNANGKPRWSIYYDYENDHLIEAVPIWGKFYTIPRWQTVSGSQYSYSPATVAGIADGRLLQAMTFTLLEAGERATNPPMVATDGAVKSDYANYAGGLTWVSNEYDERLGDALRPVTQDLRGLSFGAGLNEEAKLMLHKAFFLDTLNMPQTGPEMTAYEVGQRVQEYVRNALPIFEPLEMDYNASLCEETFELLWRNGALGNPASWPKALSGSEVEFSFESPLHDAIEQQKSSIFRESNALISEAMALDPSVAALPKAEVALRDALHGAGVPSHWLQSEAEVKAVKEGMAQQQDIQQQLGMMQQGAGIAKDLGQSGMNDA